MPLKTLYLLRHAKAVPAAPGEDDHERPLAERGQRDAGAMGEYLRREGIVPGLVLCSTSLRTRQTLHALEAAMDRPLNVRYEAGLYLAAPQDVLRVLAEAEPEAESVLLIGHNPTLHQLAYDLAREGVGRDAIAPGFPTAALAELRFDAEDWVELERGELRRFTLPGEVEKAKIG